MFRSGRLAGTYMLHGPYGSGHWPVAVSLAALLNCEGPLSSKSDDRFILPCGECRSCRMVFALNYEGLLFALPLPPHKNAEKAAELVADLLEIKRQEPFRLFTSTASTNIPVSAAREIKRSLSLKAPGGVRRLVLFHQMELMKAASADAILKLIEEPPADSVIVLTTSLPDQLPATIQSRAQKIKLGSVPEQTISTFLVEKYGLSQKRAALLSRISGRLPGLAIDMISHDDEVDNSQRAVGFYLFKSLVQQEAAQTIGHINEMLNSRDRGEAQNLLILWQALIRDCAAYGIDQDEEGIINLDFATEIKQMAPRFQFAESVLRMVDDIKITLADLRRNVHIQGALTALALKLKSCMERPLRT